MPAYVYVETTMLDDAWTAEYRARFPALLEKHGGRYIARGAPVTRLEGEGALPDLCIVFEFPTAAQARAWYDDPEYGPLIALRQTGARTNIILFESP